MEWTDDGIVLSARRHGESSAVAVLLTRDHGRHSGLVRGGGGRRQRAFLQPGMLVRARWRGRLAEQLGTLCCESLSSAVAGTFEDPLRLAALTAACAIAEVALPDRQASPTVFEGLLVLIRSLETEFWPTVYVKWELGVLGELGFGLDLASCAATGRNDQLAYVSPKSGRAVSLSAGEPYRNLLLPLPAFLVSPEVEIPNDEAIGEALELTGYFLSRHVFAGNGGLPPARARLAERFAVRRDGR